MHATREDEADHLLCHEKLVDVYAVVRQALRISQPSYSIKKVKAFYRRWRRAPGACFLRDANAPIAAPRPASSGRGARVLLGLPARSRIDARAVAVEWSPSP